MALAVLVTLGLVLAVISLTYLGSEPVSAYVDVYRHLGASAPKEFLGNCLGRFEPRFWYYPFVVFALKTPVGTLAVLALLAGLGVGGRLARGSLVSELTLHLPAALLLGALVAWATPFGSRYIVPVVPFLLVSAGRLALWARGSPGRWAPIVLSLAANVLGCAHDHPYYQSSTNLLAGDPRFVYRILDNSNQDWGGGLKALARWQRERGITKLAVLSHEQRALDAYGVAGKGAGLAIEPIFQPQPGVVFAVSTHLASQAIHVQYRRSLKGDPDCVRVLGGTLEPSEIVGGSYLIFFVPP
jgi:hypothetical protein